MSLTQESHLFGQPDINFDGITLTVPDFLALLRSDVNPSTTYSPSTYIEGSEISITIPGGDREEVARMFETALQLKQREIPQIAKGPLRIRYTYDNSNRVLTRSSEGITETELLRGISINDFVFHIHNPDGTYFLRKVSGALVAEQDKFLKKAPLHPIGFAFTRAENPEFGKPNPSRNAYEWSVMQHARWVIQQTYPSSEHKQREAEYFHILNAIHQEVFDNVEVYEHKTQLAGEEVTVGIPMSQVSTLDFALRYHLISTEQYKKAKEAIKYGKAAKNTIVRTRGYTGELGGGPCDDVRSSHDILRGVKEICDALANGQEIPETVVVTISPFQAGGKAPQRAILEKLKGPQSWLRAEAQIYKEMLVQRRIVPEGREHDSDCYTFDGDSRGAFMAWQLAWNFPELEKKRLIMRKPAGFWRGNPRDGSFIKYGLLATLLGVGRSQDQVADGSNSSRSQALRRSRAMGIGYPKDLEYCNSREQDELWSHYCRYSVPPDCESIEVIIPEDDTIVYPLNDIKDGSITRDQIREGVNAGFRQETTQVRMTQGDHILPRLELHNGDGMNEFAQEVGWTRVIAPSVPWLTKRDMTIDVLPADKEISLLQLRVTRNL